jgi:hypothetical protein
MAETSIESAPTPTSDAPLGEDTGGTPPPSGTDVTPPVEAPDVTDGNVSLPSNDGGGTLAGGEVSEDPVAPEAPPDPTWPTNWRDIAAGGDEKTLQYLNRYASPANVVKALMSTRNKITANDLIMAKPEGDARDPMHQEALNEWRAQAGIPDEPAGYLDNVPDGIVIGEDDAGVVDDFLQNMHAADAPPEYVHNALRWWSQYQENQVTNQIEHDSRYRQHNEDVLRSEWGPEFRANLNGLNNMLSQYADESLIDKIYTARFEDGSLIGNDPDFLKMMVGINRAQRRPDAHADDRFRDRVHRGGDEGHQLGLLPQCGQAIPIPRPAGYEIQD